MIRTKTHAWIIFGITSSNFFLSQFYRASNAVIAPQLMQDLSVGTKELGLLSASFFYAFAVTQIPISIFLDRVGPRRMMSGLSLLGVIGALLFAWADSLALGVVGRVLLGVGMACNLMGTLKLLTVWFSPFSFATLSGIVFSIGTAGNMAATTPLVLLVDLAGWRLAFVIVAAVNFLITAAIFVVVRDNPLGNPHSTLSHNSGEGLRQVFSGLGLLLGKRDYWIISVATFVGYGTFAAFQALWAGPYLMEAMGLSAVMTGNIIFLMNLGLIAGGPAWGAFSDRILRKRKWVILQGLVVTSLILLSMSKLSSGTGIMLLTFLFFGFGFFRASGTLMYAHIKELLPIQMAGTAMTSINFFTMIGPAVFMQGLGHIMQDLYPQASRGPDAFNAALLVCVICLAGVSVLYLLTRESKKESL